MVSPLMRIAHRESRVRLRDYDAVVLTSRNAVRATGETPLNSMPAHCVGSRTAGEARKAGFAVVTVERSAAALEERIAGMKFSGRLLFLRGAHITVDLARNLASKGIPVDEEIVYDQIGVPLGREALLALGAGVCIVTAYSRRTAELFNAQPRTDRHAHIVYCLSHNIASAVSPRFRSSIASDMSEAVIVRELAALARGHPPAT